MIISNKIEKHEWLLSSKFKEPTDKTIKLVESEIENFKRKNHLNININSLLNIIYIFANDPWTTQSYIQKKLNIEKDTLKVLNKVIRESIYFQNLITKHGSANKYWQTISPFCKKLDSAIKNKFEYPMRIGIYPGVSCMYYCGFCGRNQKEKYPSNSIESGNLIFKKILGELDPENTAISLSGGLEPVTNPKLADIIEFASNHGIKVPLITNAHSLTENYIKKNPKIMKLDSLRISLYGIDEESYEFITTVKKSYKIVKKNCINFLKYRNEINPQLKFGLNYIILKENIDNLPKLIDFVSEINSEINNGTGINFLSIRDDFDTVTGISDKQDLHRKYHLNGLLSENDREKLIKIFQSFDADERLKNIHIDYGYALYPIKMGVLGKTLKKIGYKQMRKFGHTQLSVCIDLFGDVFLYREAGFLNRKGNEKFIIGRVNNNNSLKEVIENFLYNTNGIIHEENDVRFMDPFDHVLTALINQAEEDQNFGIPFEEGPILKRISPKKINVGNSWYKDVS